jgi:hypothetical protein
MGQLELFKIVIYLGGMIGIAIVFTYLFFGRFINKDILAQLSEKDRFRIILILLLLFSLLISYSIYATKAKDNLESCKKITVQLDNKIREIDSCLSKIDSELKSKKKKSENVLLDLRKDKALLVICKEGINKYSKYQCDSLVFNMLEGKLNLNECDQTLKSY